VSEKTASADTLVEGVLAGDRTVLARAITLVESERPEDVAVAREVVRRILPGTGGAYRVGISGAPGSGKSTFIETLGLYLVEREHRVGVLAVDPSSSVSGGSVLADKSRMTELAARDRAFIRPSPAGKTLGGVARRTRETMLLLEAAGHDVVLVETVGVGQSETRVSDMVDFFLVLLLPGAGDEMQGIKRGIVELADLLAVNKADGEREALAREAVREYGAALRYLRAEEGGWRPRAVAVSAKNGTGIEEVWNAVVEHRLALDRRGELERRRAAQRERSLWTTIEEEFAQRFRDHPGVRAALPAVLEELRAERITAGEAAGRLVEAFRSDEA